VREKKPGGGGVPPPTPLPLRNSRPAAAPHTPQGKRRDEKVFASRSGRPPGLRLRSGATPASMIGQKKWDGPPFPHLQDRVPHLRPGTFFTGVPPRLQGPSSFLSSPTRVAQPKCGYNPQSKSKGHCKPLLREVQNIKPRQYHASPCAPCNPVGQAGNPGGNDKE